MCYGWVKPEDMPSISALGASNPWEGVTVRAVMTAQSIEPRALTLYPLVRRYLEEAEVKVYVYLDESRRPVAQLLAEYGDAGRDGGFGMEPDVWLYAVICESGAFQGPFSECK